jgi:hypothetical protein
MTELKILSAVIVRGEYDKMKQCLESDFPKDATLFFEYEPYCTIQSRASLKTFKLLLDDPRFVFDDLFIARQLYFSAHKSRELVMKHPKFLKVVRERSHFMDYFYERYGEKANITHVGMLQRYIQAENAIRYRSKEDRVRLAFSLYPALIKHIRIFKERYYAPGGHGFLKAMHRFQQAVLS